MATGMAAANASVQEVELHAQKALLCFLNPPPPGLLDGTTHT